MKQEDLYDDTHFMFLSDHGGVGYGHGGVSTDEMIVPWGITGPRITQGIKMKEANNTVNTAAVTPVSGRATALLDRRSASLNF